jgi:hypothetical protein
LNSRFRVKPVTRRTNCEFKTRTNVEIRVAYWAHPNL